MESFTESNAHFSSVNNLRNNFLNQYPLKFNNLTDFDGKLEERSTQNFSNNEILPNTNQQSMSNFQYKQQLYMPNSQFYQSCAQINPQPCMEYKLIDFSQNATQDNKVLKKSRVLFSQWQINELEKIFKKQKYVTSNERELIAKRLKLHGNQIKIWFQNRRYKVKKSIDSLSG